jgi:hypothetical protein
MQHWFGINEMFRQERAREFHGQELVLLSRSPRRSERCGIPMIEPSCVRTEFNAAAMSFNEPFTAKIQAQFNAIRVKRRSPIELRLREEIVPFDAVACSVKTAEQRLPTGADIAPGLRFAESTIDGARPARETPG